MHHLNFPTLRRLGEVSKLFTIGPEFPTCHSCLSNKSLRKHSAVKEEALDVFSLYHSDSGGPIIPRSIQGFEHYRLFCEGVSGMAYVFFNKSAASGATLIDSLNALRTSTGRMMNQLHSDSGTDYTSAEVRKYCHKYFIKQSFSVPGHHSGNGKCERLTRTLWDKCRSALHSANAPAVLWDYCLQATVYSYNREPRLSLGWRSPYECLYNRSPDVSISRVWGCVCYVTDNSTAGKSINGLRGIYLGINEASGNAYIVGIPFCDGRAGFSIRTTCDVDFVEHESYFATEPDSGIVFELEEDAPAIPVDDAFEDFTDVISDAPDATEDFAHYAFSQPLEASIYFTANKSSPSTLPLESAAAVTLGEELDGDYYASKLFSAKYEDPKNHKEAMARSSMERCMWIAAEDAEWFGNVLGKAVRPVPTTEAKGHLVLPTMLVYKLKPPVDAMVNGVKVRTKEAEAKVRCVALGNIAKNLRSKGIVNQKVSTFAPTIPIMMVRLLLTFIENDVFDHLRKTKTFTVRQGDVSSQ